MGKEQRESEGGARCQWLMPVIPATWKAEIGRTTVPGQPEQGACETLSQPIAGYHLLRILTIWKSEISRIMVKGQPDPPPKKVHETLISMEKTWGWWHTPVIRA
jgi:hypothetical protein